MTKDIEREAFEATQNTKVLFERIEYIESNDAYMPKNGFGNSLIVSSLAERLNFGWSMWKSATERAEKKLEGSVVAPVELSDEAIYKINDSLAFQDEESVRYAWHEMLEAARGGNHE